MKSKIQLAVLEEEVDGEGLIVEEKLVTSAADEDGWPRSQNLYDSSRMSMRESELKGNDGGFEDWKRRCSEIILEIRGGGKGVLVFLVQGVLGFLECNLQLLN